ncbi:unnamed protein product [Mytilus coruscus]|uniref:Uncharacterized protein n=1 Tax=Mytilus coruscus TaxID=42192 RepID=A0A6J8CIH8_MYTCO|nr:unnamed protein product [Mytilus coruscus]
MDCKILLLVTFYIISKLAYADICELSALFANCSQRGLSQISQNLPEYITKLELSENAITKIGSKAFKTYGKLLILHLANHKISILDSDAFVGLCEFKVLSLTRNRLDHTRYTNNVFRPLKNIQELYLNRNMRSPPPFEKEKVMVHLKILSIDLCGSSDFGIGFLKMMHLQKLTFDHCLACNSKNL